jgi:hypothetical protein
MKISWGNIIHFITNLAVLIGVLLVAYELRQNTITSRIQNTTESFGALIDFSNAFLGEEPGVILSKACLDNDNLTPEDKVVLAAMFRSRMLLTGRNTQIERIGNFGRNTENNIRTAFAALFNYQYFREQYLKQKEDMPEHYVVIADDILSNFEPLDCSQGILPANLL